MLPTFGAYAEISRKQMRAIAACFQTSYRAEASCLVGCELSAPKVQSTHIQDSAYDYPRVQAQDLLIWIELRFTVSDMEAVVSDLILLSDLHRRAISQFCRFNG